MGFTNTPEITFQNAFWHSTDAKTFALVSSDNIIRVGRIDQDGLSDTVDKEEGDSMYQAWIEAVTKIANRYEVMKLRGSEIA